MKKLLLLLFSLTLSVDSYGESLVCYYIYNGVEMTNDLKTYKREGDKFMDRQYPLDIVIDNSEVLLLEEVFDYAVFHFMLNKKTKEARFTSMKVDSIHSDIGKCEILD